MNRITTYIICYLTLASISNALHSEAVLTEWLEQYNQLQQQIEEKKALAKQNSRMPESNVFDRHALIWDTDRTPFDVQLRRTRALINHLKTMGTPGLSDLEKQLEQIQATGMFLAKTGLPGIVLAKTGTASSSDQDPYMALRKVARATAFSNPLLDDFNDIIFVERDIIGGSADGGVSAMEFPYGHNAVKGGGMYIIRNFKSDNPDVADLVEGLRIPFGTHEGMLLSEGTFISPDLSWDGNTILFAWSSGGHEKWVTENRFHIFKMNIDGTGLTRLTDGNYDDFDPCWLPDGRIAFISTRRGGNGRCHDRPVPTYTLHSMKPDGSDIVCLSYHETNEWQPSVNNDGMIVWTRWDYVDRDAMVAIHLWTCYPDGRDPRAPHGNYPLPLTTMTGSDWPDGKLFRPVAEHNIRSIPGSNRYIATATPHHGEAFGSLIFIDTHIEDDNQMSQITRITPDAEFPEREIGVLVPGKNRNDCHSTEFGPYGTAWPLNEDFYLCNYNFGIYLVDRFGNKELICQAQAPGGLRPIDPIPVQARTKPPVIPTATHQGENLTANSPNATIYVNNVYVTDEFSRLPEDVRIKEMRIVQLFPKINDVMDEPNIGYYSQSLVRMSLGTVPVEEDGSVYCEAPVEKEIYFQLLDENGMAVQSMRSGTYVHPGEQMSCVGCHESKWEAPPMTPNPLAVRRPASLIKPELEGMPGLEPVEPVNFHRLVKPVFEEKCVPCHNLQGGPGIDYQDLEDYAFGFTGYWDLPQPRISGSRTLPGAFGALASRLYSEGYLDSSHYDVSLTPYELRRITLWLDLNSNELGAYVNQDAQRRGELIWPDLDVDPDNPLGVERRVLSVPRDKEIKRALPGLTVKKTRDRIYLQFPKKDDYTVRVENILGKTSGFYRVNDAKKASFSISSLPRGIYMIKAVSGNNCYQKKLVLM
jgi:hypothetical protein